MKPLIKDFFNKKGFNILAAKPFDQLSTSLQEKLLLISPELAGKSIMIIAAGGKSLWENISRDEALTAESDKLDQYSLGTLKECEHIFPMKVDSILYPNDNLNIPLSAVSREILNVIETPCGLLMQEKYGMWFGIRLLISLNLNLEIEDNSLIFNELPCENCQHKNCLSPFDPEKDLRLSCHYKSEEAYSESQLAHQRDHLKKNLAYIRL